ncbi:MAG: peptide ABC transporter substrate-binding protein [Nitrospinae bacterium RIFCSPLOWO2_02_FULL_39_110]|nr:MAG: peptide ABC transporter substrate-binding protein [Nitrospinae bacterium RIFCSPHIGHO2_12_FULL_39_42]OGV99670.1 MAG: peptide ABC transporter substrate-binding protein [Nitrospinae bacterium RIFCSPHIGHO2_02_FULL_39_82]OGW03826.1 MAG: peptide ABC transporter substrate-binding protein [Nitrospinae bacterium RIFCSPLOWO2_02_FULL_39_110]OGW08935.1 MAG: peptide ABC transporter substrate-binding protein [Nitrospinae bacterium RIFCSPLOWO2_12_FULL_39_93]OGW09437.1 MAG: peptide ABC transporter subs
MIIKRLFLIIPLVITILLLQSFFWVPTYDNQIKGSRDRLYQFIQGSIGDASILNPILSADASSSDINSMVFEGLLDYDEELRYRGRLATNWEIYEEAVFFVNMDGHFPDETPVTAKEIVKKINDYKIRNPKSEIQNIDILPPQAEIIETRDPRPEKKGAKVVATLTLPQRIKVTLKTVDQEFFKKMGDILGKDYFSSIHPERYITVSETTPPLSPPLKGGELEGVPDLLEPLSGQLVQTTEHNPVIIFHLRKGVLFHDGHEFDARDVKFTYESIMDPRNLSPRVSDYEPVKSLEVIDKYTVKITYKRLYSPAISTWMMGILPEHLLNKEALTKEAKAKGADPNKFTIRDSDFNRNPVGVGPFKFKEWKSDEYIRLVKNDGYWEGPPNYKEFIYRIIPDLLGQEMEFYAGTVDSYDAQAHQVERFKKDKRFHNFSGLSYGYTYIGYNMRRDIFKDWRVRKALGMAINVDEIIKYLFYNQAEKITGPFVKQTDYYNHNITPLPYDPEGALKLLEEAGWKKVNGRLEKNGKPFQFIIITNHGNELRKAIMIIAQNSWKKLGIDVRADTVEWAVFLKKYIDVGNFDAVILGWSMGIDPDLYQIWHSSQTGPFQLNFVGYNNPEADDLIIKIRQEYDRNKQIEYCNKLHETIYRDQPYTFLYVGKWTALMDKKIVISERMTDGKEVIRPITPTKTGNFRFHFNKWIKLSQEPVFLVQ